MNRRTSLLFLSECLLLSGLATAAGCRRRRSPEEQVRDTIAALAHAVEEKDLKTVRKLVSERYQDAEQHDRQEVLALLRMYFARYPSIHLATRVTAVEIAPAGDAPARVTVVVAMASVPMNGLEDLLRLHADVNRFDLTLIEEAAERWTVTGATWQAARPEDLF
jgi:hypothetical protein